MKTLFRIFLGLFIFIILIVIGLSSFVRFYLTEENLTEMLVPQAEKALGRQVSIGGIEVSLFKGIIVKDLVVKEADGSRDFVSSGSFVLRYELMPLLQKKVVVSEIRLENPSIRVERDKDGKFNFESLAILAGEKAEKTPAESAPSSAAALPLALTVDTISISGARFSLIDAKGELPAVDAQADVTIGVDIARDMADMRFQGQGTYTVFADYQGVKPELKGSFDFDRNRLGFSSDVLVDGEKVHVAGTVDNYMKVPAIEVNVASKELNLDKLLALAGALGGQGAEKGASSEKIAGSPSVQKSAAPPAAIGDQLPKGLTAHGTVKVDKALYQAFTIDNFQLAYRLENNVFTVKDLTANAAGGTISSDMAVDLNVPDMAYKGNVAVDSIGIPQIQAAFFPDISENISGALSTAVSYSGVGTKWPEMQDRLTADGTFSLLDGALKNSAMTRSIASLTGIQELQDLVFDTFSGNFRLTEGNVLLKSSVDGKDIDLQTEGVIGLDSTLDLPMTIILSPELSTKLASKSSIAKYLADEEGQTTLRLKMAGTVKKPRPTLDSAAVQEQVKDTLKEKALTEIGKALGGDKDAAATGTDTGASSLEETGKSLLKGLFGN